MPSSSGNSGSRPLRCSSRRTKGKQPDWFGHNVMAESMRIHVATSESPPSDLSLLLSSESSVTTGRSSSSCARRRQASDLSLPLSPKSSVTTARSSSSSARRRHAELELEIAREKTRLEEEEA